MNLIKEGRMISETKLIEQNLLKQGYSATEVSKFLSNSYFNNNSFVFSRVSHWPAIGDYLIYSDERAFSMGKFTSHSFQYIGSANSFKEIESQVSKLAEKDGSSCYVITPSSFFKPLRTRISQYSRPVPVGRIKAFLSTGQIYSIHSTKLQPGDVLIQKRQNNSFNVQKVVSRDKIEKVGFYKDSEWVDARTAAISSAGKNSVWYQEGKKTTLLLSNENIIDSSLITSTQKTYPEPKGLSDWHRAYKDRTASWDKIREACIKLHTNLGWPTELAEKEVDQMMLYWYNLEKRREISVNTVEDEATYKNPLMEDLIDSTINGSAVQVDTLNSESDSDSCSDILQVVILQDEPEEGEGESTFLIEVPEAEGQQLCVVNPKFKPEQLNVEGLDLIMGECAEPFSTVVLSNTKNVTDSSTSEVRFYKVSRKIKSSYSIFNPLVSRFLSLLSKPE